MHIEIPGDELIPDEALAAEWNCTRRTLWRYDQLPDGLPYIIIAGRKYRPRKACGEWLAKGLRRPNPRRVA